MKLITDPGLHPNGVEGYKDEQERCDAAEEWGVKILLAAHELAALVFAEHGDRTATKEG